METPTTLEVVEGVDLTGKTCVITGASAGLGKESARALAKTGAHVILAARNHGSPPRRGGVDSRRGPRCGHIDRRTGPHPLAGIRTAAAAIQDLAPEIHVLMNNAGVMFTPFSRTSDGFEIQFGTNHLGHFELTRLLTPQLWRGRPHRDPVVGRTPDERRRPRRPQLGAAGVRQVRRVRRVEDGERPAHGRAGPAAARTRSACVLGASGRRRDIAGAPHDARGLRER